MASQSSCDRAVSFTPLESTLGGVLLGLSTSALLLGYGRVMNFSAVLDHATDAVVARAGVPSAWDTCLLLGLVGGGALSKHFASFPVPTIDYPLLMYAAAGLLVGIGSSMCSGCILSHSLFGVGRLSPRSFALATLFIVVGAFTSYITLHFVEGCAIGPDTSYVVPLAILAKEDVIPLLGGTMAVIVLLVVSLSMAIDWPSRDAAHQEAAGTYTPRRIISWITHSCVAFSIGMSAGLGLVLAGMLSQEKVRSSLDIMGGPWDPSLALALGVALAISSLAHRYASILSEPYLAHNFDLSPKSELGGEDQGSHGDLKLFIGLGAFGIGWGVLGISPGASVVGIAAPMLEGVDSGSWRRFPVFLVSSIVGGQLASRFAEQAVASLSEAMRAWWQRLTEETRARMQATVERVETAVENVKLAFGVSRSQIEADEAIPQPGERSPVYGSPLQWSTRAPMPSWSQL